MAITYESVRMTGLSTDIKPTTVQDNSWFFETDTSKTFDFDSATSTWTERSSSRAIWELMTYG